ncbi:amino acid ABC transporter permease [Microvirga pudoricolor]|uniref:amino acid ABC transporter permease n=1 Tax=Microvirga pudoricolor TaxID=2778729 RepID=UPI00194E99BC|nr:amino acid ABC transporter permease [Microvirga pudoricolor]MBM6596336.1 amino acid ABC transporter permease [Microvirga pudoricolor]
MSDWDRFVSAFLNVNVAARYWPDILAGVAVTVLIGLAVVVTGILVGLGLAVLRSLGNRFANLLIVQAVDVLRSLPPLVIILVIYFGLPNVGIALPSFVVLWLSLSAVLAAFAEEVFWAGITAVPQGQWMAARSTGLTFGQALTSVVLPQAVRIAIPPLTNRTISITKNTALGSAIGVSEILGRAMSAQSFAGNATPLTIAAVLYVLIFIPLVVASRSLERRYAWRRR